MLEDTVSRMDNTVHLLMEFMTCETRFMMFENFKSWRRVKEPMEKLMDLILWTRKGMP
jgi:hypothetical protein